MPDADVAKTWPAAHFALRTGSIYPFRGEVPGMALARFTRLPRRGAILLVVASLLALFAVVGLTFVLYANAQAQSAQLYRAAQVPSRPDVDPDLLLSFFLGQLLYDVHDDEAGVYSALRGHSLARSLYGWNDGGANDVPFNGTGRLHQTYPLTHPVTWLGGVDDFDLVNYTYFRDDPQVPPPQRFLRDPERPGLRAGLAAARAPFAGGFNAPYTYPDLNNLYLAAVRADGTLLTPSFHRHWLFNPRHAFNDAENKNWTNAAGKYLTLRPRPIDMGPGFPMPEDERGDVKNLAGAPGGNDSIWIDLGAPVLTAADGRKYKALFAPLIVDLDNRINVNIHGNVSGFNGAHLSNQGWGPWEVNVGRVLNRGGEWQQLFRGSAVPPQTGRYGAGGPALPPNNVASFGATPRFYARIDFDGGNEWFAGLPSGPLVRLPGSLWPATNCFPSFPLGYGDGSPREGTDHPSLYNAAAPAGDDRAFALSNLEALLRYGDTGSPALTSELLRLCPTNFGADPNDPSGAARRRRLVTTLSADPDKPGMTPWLWNPRQRPYVLNPGDTQPQGRAAAFPSLTRLTRPPAGSEFAPDGRAAVASLGRVDLNRPLPDYPHPDAQSARVQLARDLFARLRLVTGAADPAQALPGSPQYNAVRWLAQLAVNIVDYVDADDCMTPFFWNPRRRTEVVLGTELPRVLLNEVFVEHERQNPGLFNVRVWAELHNPFFADPALSDGGAARLATASQPIYQLVLSKPNVDLRRPDNVLGLPDAGTILSSVSDFAANALILPSDGSGSGRSGFYVLGPGLLPGGEQPSLRSEQMRYHEQVAESARTPTPPTLLLRRLANPYLPAEERPGPKYNPFVTVDYLELHRVPGVRLDGRRSYGRAQPYAGDVLQLRGQSRHTFFQHNQPRREPFEWLVHLDRPLLSPMELLHVSGFKPHELTQQFVTPVRAFDHRVRWLEADGRLYRVFEFLTTHSRVAGVPAAPGGRVFGKINVNTIWDPETLLALCDPQPSNNFVERDLYDPTYPRNPDTVFGRLMERRTLDFFDGGGPGPDDQPFLGLATGATPPGDRQYPRGAGPQNTLLQLFERTGDRLLFQPETPPSGPNRHPYLQNQLLTKIFNHVTTRSNVFAVWLTVGFFEVTDDTTRPVKLGAEVGRAENRHVRHRMFAVVDRSVLRANPGPQPRFDLRAGTSPGAAPGVQAVPYFSIIE